MKYDGPGFWSEAEKTVMDYIKDRRYSIMFFAYAIPVIVIIAVAAAANDLVDILNGNIRASEIYRYRGETRFSGGTGTALCMLLPILLVFFMFMRKFYGRVFGRGSDYECMKHQKYKTGYVTVACKHVDNGKRPYCVTDQEGNAYICPVFLDYRNASLGDEMICLILDNGVRYALRKETYVSS